MKEYSSIFNHALAPITPGPSSSNTCGPVRIGLVSQQIFGGIPARVTVEYDREGAFPSTLYGMKSDIAFISGLLGHEQNVPDFTEAYEKAETAGMKVHFAQVDDLKIGGLEVARLRMTAHDGRELVVVGESLGGGAFKIHLIDDCPVCIQGMNHELLVFVRDEAAARALTEELSRQMASLNHSDYSVGGRYAIVNLKGAVPFPDELIKRLRQREGISQVRAIAPLHPIVASITRKPPFQTAAGMVDYCRMRQCSPAQAAIDYEMAVSGWSADEIRRYGEMLLDIMRQSQEGGFRSGLCFDGIMSPRAAMMQGRIGTGKMPSLGLLNEAIPSALGIMEYSNASGKIVCVPTGGSSGIVPGLLLTAAKQLELSDQQLYEAMMCAGVVGVLMMVDGNEFSGGAHGCQAEVACGTAMAAAGLVQMIAGDAKAVCDAASMSLQCFMGLVCDPVAGLVQVPCLARNIAGVSVAAAAAEAVCSGFEVVLPLDEMSHAMVLTGAAVTDALGIGCSGCCVTPTGIRLTQEREAVRSR